MRSDLLRHLAALLVGAGSMGIPTLVGAQTHFPSPPDRANYAHYTIPQECVVAVARVTDSAQFQQRLDTLPYSASDPLPAAAVETARRCAANFTAAGVDTNSLPALRDLALAANDDSLAVRAVDRQSALSRGRPDSVRAQILIDAMFASANAKPVRIQLARHFMAQLDQLGPRVSLARLNARSILGQALTNEMKDLAGMLELAKEAADIAQHAPPDVRAANPQGWQMADNLVHLTDVFVTSMRDGPAAALEEMKARGWNTGTPLGLRAAAIASPYWFNRPDQAPRPGVGKLALVVFVDPACGDGCFPGYATLRRVARRHPELEITLVAGTHGHVGRRLTPNASDEAPLARQYLLDYHQLPGALAVDSTPFFRLPAPDGRIVPVASPNQVAYGTSLGAGLLLSYYMVGPDGIIDFYGGVSPQQEKQMDAEIAAIERSSGVSQAAP